MAAATKKETGRELCRGCKEDFPAIEHELNYEGYCSLCAAAHAKLEREEEVAGK